MLVPLLLIVVLFQDTVPHKAEGEFIIKFEFAFRKRSDPRMEDVVQSQVASSPQNRIDTSPLPHLKATLKVLKPDSLAVKFIVVRDHTLTVARRKIDPDSPFTVFSTFVDDIRDQIEGYHHTIYFLDKKGVRLSKIVIEFDEEGFYFVNGKRKGKI